ncbi:MAG TPA: ferritin family protein [Burkholderiales bacterium]|nr:ferritin family protein [Burkholderiales bacterium]
MKPIRSAPELYAHAIEVEREAAERYGAFAQSMSDMGAEALASVFATLARLDTEHLVALERQTLGLALPKLDTQGHRWLEAGAPESAAHELVLRLMTPKSALNIALGAERRAQAFFEFVLITADDPALRSLAREMGAEEAEHVTMIERLLAHTPQPLAD